MANLNINTTDNLIQITTQPTTLNIVNAPLTVTSNGIASGSNTQVQYNNNGSFGSSANFTYNQSTSNLVVTGNVIGNHFGSGAGLTNLPGGNVSGQVANALVAGTVYTNAQPNITSVGVLDSLSMNGTLFIGNRSQQDAVIELGYAGTGNRYSYIDFVSDDTYTDYGLRIIRNNGGPNTDSFIQSRGTGPLNIATIDAAPIQFLTNSTVRTTIQADGHLIAARSVTANADHSFIAGPLADGNVSLRMGQNSAIRDYGNNTVIYYDSGVGATSSGGSHIFRGSSTYNTYATISNSGISVAGSANVVNVNATGNVTGNFFIGDGRFLSNITTTAGTSIINGTSNVFVFPSGDVTTSVAGNANVFLVNGTGANVNGNLAVSGSFISTQPTFRNKILNGDMSVLDNRLAYGGTANIISPTSGFTRAFATDRWRYERLNTGGNISADLNQGNYTRVPGFPMYLGFTCNATVVTPGTNERSGVYQQIEPINTWDFAWGTSGAKPVTLSFWVRSSVTGTFSGAVLGAAVTWSYVFNYTVNSANTWEFKTISIPGNTSGNWNNTTQPLTVYFSFACGTALRTSSVNTWINAPRTCSTTALNPLATAGATFALTGVQLENSPVATPFEYRPVDVETRMCQKYFQGYTDPPLRGVFAGTGLGRVGMVLPTTMRTSPANEVSGTFNWYDGANTWTTNSLPSASYNTNRSIEYDFNTITGAGTIVTGRAAILYYNNSGTLRLDAEFSAFT